MKVTRLGLTLWVIVVVCGCSSQKSSADIPLAETFLSRISPEAVTYELSRKPGDAIATVVALVPVGHDTTGEEKLLFQQVKGVIALPNPQRTLLENFNDSPSQFFAAAIGVSREQSREPRPKMTIVGNAADSRLVSRLLDLQTDLARSPYLKIKQSGIGPFGVSNSFYFGHVFWDMDVWMLPAMLFTNPNAIREMVQYRMDRVAQATKNYDEFLTTTKRAGKSGGIMFPWESAFSGKETVLGPSKAQHHITASVVWGLTQAEHAGLASPEAVGRVAEGAKSFYLARSDQTSRGREICGVMSPDEFRIADNDLYTNLLADWLVHDRRWSDRPDFALPKDRESFLTYDLDALRGYKQAAAVLAIYPLRYPVAVGQGRAMMNRFEFKVTKNGPSMSESIHSTVWSILGEPEKAYKAWTRATANYITEDQYFSEKRSSYRVHFYTGAAGVINSVLYGFCGFETFKLSSSNLQQKWKPSSIPIGNGWALRITPRLPLEWKQIRLQNFTVGGKRFDITVSANHVEIVPLGQSRDQRDGHQ